MEEKTGKGERREAFEGAHRRVEESLCGDNEGKPWKEGHIRDFKAAVEILSGGNNTVIVDDWGLPSVMVRVTSQKVKDLLSNGSDAVHPAFYAGGKVVSEIYVSKFQNILINGRGYSLPWRTPACGICFDQALAACREKGTGWNLTTFSVRAALALMGKKQGFFPHGNSDGSVDYHFREERGIPGEGKIVKSGSGPVTWANNMNYSGIWDLTGNLNEWDGGLRLVDGEIQVIPEGRWMEKDCTMQPDCAYWRAIAPDGSLLEPGSSGSLKYDSPEGGVLLTDRLCEKPADHGNCAFGEIQVKEGLPVPELLYALMLFPEERNGKYDGWRWIKARGECLPLCGGGYKALDHAGIFFVGLTYPRTHHYGLAGFRSIYVK